MPNPLRLAIVGLLLAVAATANLASAQDLYVNAATGDDGNDGLSESSAFRTISRALENGTVGPIRSVLVAPGIYDSALGETFPLRVRRRRDILGTRGAIIDAGGAAVAIQTNGRSGQPILGVRGVEIRNAQVGLRLQGGRAVGGSLAISDCDVGIFASNLAAPATLRISSIACRIERCRVGIQTQGRIRLGLQACKIREIVEDGVTMDYAGSTSSPALRIDRTSILDCGRDAIRFEAQPGRPAGILVMGSVIGASQVGIHLPDSTIDARVSVDLFSTTVASNGAGLALPTRVATFVAVNDSILAQNGVDVQEGTATVEIRDSLIEGGQYADQPGVITADPEFVDADGRNYRLRRSSPAVDAALPVYYTFNAPTLSGRRCDADQDGLLEKDFGAHDFTTLRAVGEAVSGQRLPLEIYGEANATGFLFRSDGLPQVPGFGIRTLSGLLELDRTTATLQASFTLPASGGTTSVLVPITSDPAMIGRFFLYQGILSSSASPSGWAFTNRVMAFVVAP